MSSRKIIDDFGEKIGGAKKDYWRNRGVFVEDVDNLSTREIEEIVRKDNIWHIEDYKEYLKFNMEPVCIYFIKLVRDKLPAKVELRGDSKDRERAKVYINFLNDIKKTCERLRTKQDIQNFWKWILVDNGYYIPESRMWTQKAKESAWLLTESFLNLIKLRDKDLEEIYYECLIQGFPENYDNDLKGLSIKYIPFYKAYVIVKGKGSYGSNYFNSADEALEYVRNVVIPKIKGSKNSNKKRGISIERPQLKYIKRIGPDVRCGRDIEAEDFLAIFKFRGGEFGNWNNQADRQVFLNYAFEALVDFAVVLGIPLDFLSFYPYGSYNNMRLAIAFGARGSGYASAHYEPDKVVINLTKLRGAGSLAHEWAHALDDFLGVRCGLTGVRCFLSENYNKKIFDDEFLDIIEAFKNVMNAIYYRERTFDENVELYKNEIAKWCNNLKVIVKNMLYDLKDLAKVNGVEDFEIKVKKLMSLIDEGKMNRKEFDNLVYVYKNLKGRLPSKEYRDMAYNYIHSIESWKNKLEEALKTGKFERITHDYSNFYKESKRLDEGRSTTYYSTAPELFARVFEAFVEDLLTENNLVSQYLVHYTHNNIYGEYKPYPEGEERKAINSAMYNLINVVKSKFSSNYLNHDIFMEYVKYSYGYLHEDTHGSIEDKIWNDFITNESEKIDYLELYRVIKYYIENILNYGYVEEGIVHTEFGYGKSKLWVPYPERRMIVVDSQKGFNKMVEALLEAIVMVKVLDDFPENKYKDYIIGIAMNYFIAEFKLESKVKYIDRKYENLPIEIKREIVDKGYKVFEYFLEGINSIRYNFNDKER